MRIAVREYPRVSEAIGMARNVNVRTAETCRIVRGLKALCAKEPDIATAFLFGSWTNRRNIPESDVDVAIYLKKPWNTCRIHRFWGRLEETAGHNADPVVMNETTPAIAWAALRGIPLKIADRRFHLGYMLRISKEAEDFQEFVIDFCRWKDKIRNSHVAA